MRPHGEVHAKLRVVVLNGQFPLAALEGGGRGGGTPTVGGRTIFGRKIIR